MFQKIAAATKSNLVSAEMPFWKCFSGEMVESPARYELFINLHGRDRKRKVKRLGCF